MDLSQFRDDHEFLRRQALRLAQLIAQDERSLKLTRDLHTELHVMRARLALHLAIEDRFLYPEVEATHHDGLDQTARSLRQALGHLDQSLAELVDRYDDVDAIDEQPEQFRQLLETLLTSLQARMAQEEEELFPIAAEI